MHAPNPIEAYIRTIPDFPHEGILFRDVTTLFADPEGLRLSIEQLTEPYRGRGIDKVAGIEARGFILGGAIAQGLGAGFVPIRKAGKLPGATIQESYTLEYGEAVVEVHDDALQPGETVLLVDDLLATGGTAEAGIKLLERLGAKIAACAFVVDLPDLGGGAKLREMGMEVQTLCAFEGL
ncbi:Adenine phosphoribosyltransferase [Candidatus Rhodobacter oscarellae]|uniref:Adenine phosphoribosyltransferase n=1 Tax=Candidatus Rhodobacter oscarellae TaxID=1675527 RepID=A0A0J9E5D1_9RHOB|nr:adenine phosphoribosyltransferase [Candidatus Rhodobacter lobularis]KMW57980.1 Adenine phosphoribosyltransferase [Candidatus Rhodobacter lobularis]